MKPMRELRSTWAPYYVGSIANGLGPQVTRCEQKLGETVKGTNLNPRLDLRNHSPDGFAWGYHGSGPAQLALAILADFTEDDEFALAHYQRFKDRHIAPINKDGGFRMGSGLIVGFLIKEGGFDSHG